jgi:hypothetical protein
LEDGCFFEFGLGVDVAAGCFAEFPGARFEDDVAAGFFEDEVEDGDQGGVVDELDVEDPIYG